MIRLDAHRLRPGRLHAPPSKSDAVRRLLLAEIAGAPGLFETLQRHARPWPDDVERVAAGLQLLRDGGTGALLDIDCGDGAAPLRLLIGQAAIRPCRVRFHGSARLGRRPHGPLLAALVAALGASGLSITSGTPWPIEVHGTAGSGAPRFRVAGGESSQYASSLLLAAAALAKREGRPWAVELEDDPPSPGYLELTLASLGVAGFTTRREGRRLEIAGWRAPRGFPPLPSDWSSLGYLLPIAWRSGASVAGVDLSALHPDRCVVELLASVGLLAAERADGDFVVRGDPRGGLAASGRACPDLIPTLAALATVLPGESLFTDLRTLRHKESDRVEGMVALLEAAGARPRLEGETLRVPPLRRSADPLRFDSRGDHRLAMAAATLAVCGGVALELEGHACIAKSFPGFLAELERVGVGVS